MVEINVIKGKAHEDFRGRVSHFNEFDLVNVKRIYSIEHYDVSIVRAWQGHQKERKWFFVTKGAFKFVFIQPDNWFNPSIELPYHEFILSEKENKIICLPGGYVSGFNAIEPNSKMIVFSDFSLEESKNDDFRFDKSLWYKW